MKVINKQISKGKWFTYPKDKSIELLIRPLSIYDFNKLPSESLEITPEEFGNFASNLLLDWKGIIDEKGKPLKCDEDNKKLLADHDQELASFIMNMAAELKNDVITDKEVKN